MTGRMFVLSVVIAAVWCGASLAATPPKAWQWTPAKASAAAHGKCVGRGVAVSGRFTSFRCVVGGKVLWAKVRRAGTGKLCTSRKSLVAVPAACLRVAVAVPPPAAAGWTPAEASSKLLAAQPSGIIVNGGTIEKAVCVGSGPGAAGHFTAFRCDTVFKASNGEVVPMVAWVKVSDAGALCASRISLDEARCD